jgi:polyisoprenoid-binding protein YceI
MRTKLLKVAALSALLTVTAMASAALKTVGGSSVQFLAIGPAGLKINGHSSDLRGSEADGKLTMVAKLTDLKTGIGLRDKHLRGYLNTNKHSEARLVVAKSDLKMPADKQTITGRAAGRLTLHGVTKPIKFDYRAKRTGSDYHVQGMTEIDIRDYQVEVPCYLGVCVEPQVKIKVKFKLRDGS